MTLTTNTEFAGLEMYYYEERRIYQSVLPKTPRYYKNTKSVSEMGSSNLHKAYRDSTVNSRGRGERVCWPKTA
jgi:hypothetical protein